MKIWLAAVVTGMALVAAWKLPPDSVGGSDVAVVPAEVRRAAEIDRAYRVTTDVLQRLLWSDSLAPLALESATDGVALLYPRDAGANQIQAQSFETRVRAEVERIRAEDVTFAYIFQPNAQSLPDGVREVGRARTETYAGMLGGRAYCLQVRVFHGSDLGGTLAERLGGNDRGGPASGEVGVCRPYLRFGMPGRHVADWISEGGATFAQEAGEPVQDVLPGAALSVAADGLFGMSQWNRARTTLDVQRCAAGVAAACSGIFLRPGVSNPQLERNLEVVARAPVTWIGTSSFRRTSFQDDGYLLWDLQQEFGDEAFARFWTSDADVATAFEDAFGIAPGPWMVSWVDRVVGIESAGPALPRSASTGGTLAIALLLAITYARNRQREAT